MWLTHNRNTIIDIWTPWPIEDLAWVRIRGAGGNVICHHDHNIFFRKATMSQDLVCLYKAASTFSAVTHTLRAKCFKQASEGNTYMTNVSLVTVVAPPTRSSKEKCPNFACRQVEPFRAKGREKSEHAPSHKRRSPNAAECTSLLPLNFRPGRSTKSSTAGRYTAATDSNRVVASSRMQYITRTQPKTWSNLNYHRK